MGYFLKLMGIIVDFFESGAILRVQKQYKMIKILTKNRKRSILWNGLDL